MAGFGERLKEVRGEMSQLQFSTVLGISQTKLSRVEREVSEPDMALLEALSEQFDVSLDWLIVGRGSRQRTHGQEVAQAAGSVEMQHMEEKIHYLNAIIHAEKETIDAQRALIETLRQPEDPPSPAADDAARNVPVTGPLRDARGTTQADHPAR